MNVFLIAGVVLADMFVSRPTYEFVADYHRVVGIGRPGGTAIGRINKDGKFTFMSWQSHDAISSFELYELLNTGGLAPRDVYELRGDVLVPGTITCAGPFVPSPGQAKVAFSEYVYSPSGNPIWNLPGRYRLTFRRPTDVAKPKP